MGFGEDIWVSLLGRIESEDKAYNGFRIMKKIINRMLPKLSNELVVQLLKVLKERLIREFHQCRVEDGDGEKYQASPSLLECLDVISELSEQGDELETRPELIEAMWQTFDLFAFTRYIEFDDNILRIFNNVLTSTSRVDVHYFQFCEAFV